MRSLGTFHFIFGGTTYMVQSFSVFDGLIRAEKLRYRETEKLCTM